MKKISISLLATLMSIKTVFTFESSGGASGSINNPLRFGSLSSLLVEIGKQLYLVAIPIVTIMILYGAFLMLTSGGDPAQFNKGKKAILYAVIGFIVVLVAGGIPTLIQGFLS
ncbi:MAG: hypothetical protein V1652_04105 [bacterium]